MDYLNADLQDSTIEVPPSDRTDLPGRWVTVHFNHTISDTAGHLAGNGNTFCRGSRYCHGVVDLWLVDFQLGVEIQIRTFETDSSGNRLETHLPHEFYTSAEDSPLGPDGQPLYPRTTHHRYPVMAYVNSGHLLGVEVAQWPHDPAAAPPGTIKKAQVQANMW